MIRKIVCIGLTISLISGVALADQCPDPNHNFTGAGIITGGNTGELTCIYTDHTQKLAGTYQIIVSHWRRTEFGLVCGDAQMAIHPASYCQFIKIQ